MRDGEIVGHLDAAALPPAGGVDLDDVAYAAIGENPLDAAVREAPAVLVANGRDEDVLRPDRVGVLKGRDLDGRRIRVPLVGLLARGRRVGPLQVATIGPRPCVRHVVTAAGEGHHGHAPGCHADDLSCSSRHLLLPCS